MKHLKMSYSDIMVMPTYERRFYIDMFKSDMDKEQDRYDEAKKNNSSGGKGTRSKTVSGNALKSQMLNNQIPND
jgi:hypothetical protein